MPYTPSEMASAIRNLGVVTLQNKTVTPSTTVQTIGADNNYDGLNQVTVNAISPTLGAQTYTPTTTNQTISSGQWLAGTQTILGDSNLAAANIKKDVTIFNITGTYEGSTPTESLYIDENGTYDVTDYGEVEVDVAGEGDPEYTIQIPIDQAIGIIQDFFDHYSLANYLGSSGMSEWSQYMNAIFGGY